MKFHDITRGTGLEMHGITNANLIYWTAPTAVLYEQIVKRGEGLVTHLGAIAVKTGHNTRRLPKNRFIVNETGSASQIAWNTGIKPLEPGTFESLYGRMLEYVHGRDLFVQDCFAGADRVHRLPLRIITEKAWHSLFARNMFIQARPEELEHSDVPFTMLVLPNFHALPSQDGIDCEAFIITSFDRRMILIGGTSYAGEIRKSIFTILGYLLPLDWNVLPLHCSASVGPAGDTALFFGAPGACERDVTIMQDRLLVGEEEHGWDERGIFNLEGGCYSRVMHLSQGEEPHIHATTRKFGTILENVAIDTHTRRVNLDDASFTENTRASYPLSHLPRIAPGCAGHPATIVMVVRDAYGVLPPIARLSREQAAYFFLAGYSSAIKASAQQNDGPIVPTFSPCFSGDLLPLNPAFSVRLLSERLARHTVACWMINTGWYGGPGNSGNMVSRTLSRTLVQAALDGLPQTTGWEREPFFGLQIPTACPGVPGEMLNPRSQWKDTSRYDRAARELVEHFQENFRHYDPDLPPELRGVLQLR